MRVSVEWSGNPSSRVTTGLPEIPAHTEPVCGQTQELALGVDAFETHHELEVEEDDRIDRRPALGGLIAAVNEIAHEGEGRARGPDGGRSGRRGRDPPG